MSGIIVTELSEEQVDRMKNFFKENPKRRVIRIEVGGRRYQLDKKAVMVHKTIELVGELD